MMTLGVSIRVWRWRWKWRDESIEAFMMKLKTMKRE